MCDLSCYIGEVDADGVTAEDVHSLVDVKAHPVRDVLDILLQDKTTKRNIIWATDAYEACARDCGDTSCIRPDVFLTGNPIVLTPRIEKAIGEQLQRTRAKAEVFTPIWICNRMNNECDRRWFGRDGVFNVENEDHTWTVAEEPVAFPEGRTWRDYVDSRRLEITCGEAPFLVSRYDMATGRLVLPPKRRIGVIDRKLRVVGENASSREEWEEWALRAFQSCYGYEWQGDSLLIARVNMLLTFCDYYKETWGEEPGEGILRDVARVIAWNMWQMDGLTDAVPFGKPARFVHQMTLLDDFVIREEVVETSAQTSRIYDWRRDNSAPFYKCKGRGKMKKKLFDFVIGNPPYQEMSDSNGRQPPVYHKFIDSSIKVANAVELITPARFLSGAGQTPKEWNERMLSDPHFCVLSYEKDSEKIFPGTDIKGGVAITYYDWSRNDGPIGVFTPDLELNGIIQKVIRENQDNGYLLSIVSSQGISRFSQVLFDEHPEASSAMGSGTGDKIVSRSVPLLPDIFRDSPLPHEECFSILVKGKSGRFYRYIPRRYVLDNEYADKYNVVVPESNGRGAFEAFSSPLIAPPGTITTDTFLSIGMFDKEDDAKRLLTYIKTKFARALLGAKKVTQHNPKSTWAYVPMQDFSSGSDIDWSRPIPEIDRQLYEKYGLSPKEIEFVESRVQEMR